MSRCAGVNQDYMCNTAAMVTNSGVEYDSETACDSGKWPIA